jgi:hypothetical protein
MTVFGQRLLEEMALTDSLALQTNHECHRALAALFIAPTNPLLATMMCVNPKITRVCSRQQPLPLQLNGSAGAYLKAAAVFAGNGMTVPPYQV